MIKQIVKIGDFYYLRKLTLFGWKYYDFASHDWWYIHTYILGAVSEEEIRNAYSDSKPTLKHVAWM